MAEQMTQDRQRIADFLIDRIVSDMVEFLIDDYGYSIEEALDVVYTSRLLAALADTDTELYVQSSSYHYESLLKEKGLLPVGDDRMGIVADGDDN